MLTAHSTICKRERWTHSKCLGEILQHVFCNEPMTSVLYSFWKADDHQICWGTWEQSSWASVRRRQRSEFPSVVQTEATAAEDSLHQEDGSTRGTQCCPHLPWCWPATHCHSYPRYLCGLRQSFAHRMQRSPTVSHAYSWSVISTARKSVDRNCDWVQRVWGEIAKLDICWECV